MAPNITALLDECDLLRSMEREEMFQYGFCLGLRLVLEALSVSNT